jgi:hypothetical protein
MFKSEVHNGFCGEGQGPFYAVNYGKNLERTVPKQQFINSLSFLRLFLSLKKAQPFQEGFQQGQAAGSHVIATGRFQLQYKKVGVVVFFYPAHYPAYVVAVFQLAPAS